MPRQLLDHAAKDLERKLAVPSCEKMLESKIVKLERARERVPEVRPRLISDNSSAFIARDFKGTSVKLT